MRYTFLEKRGAGEEKMEMEEVVVSQRHNVQLRKNKIH